MKKDMKRHSFNRHSSHAKHPSWQWIFAITMSIFISMIVIIVAYKYPFQTPISSFIPGPIVSYTEKIRSWITERKEHFHKKMDKVKQVALRRVDSNPPPIQFEFYTALPNMQIPVPEPETKVSSSTTKSTQEKKSIALFDAERLQREFKQELNKNLKN